MSVIISVVMNMAVEHRLRSGHVAAELLRGFCVNVITIGVQDNTIVTLSTDNRDIAI